MYIKDYHDANPWLTKEEVIERVANEIQRGRIVIATEEERRMVDAGEWKRVGTWVMCETCNKPFNHHPFIDYHLFLHRLCDGTLGKT